MSANCSENILGELQQIELAIYGLHSLLRTLTEKQELLTKNLDKATRPSLREIIERKKRELIQPVKAKI